MKRSFLYILAIGLFLSAQTFAQSVANKTINKYVAAQAKEGKAVEHKDARMILYADVNGDGKKDAIVQYTLEGFDGGNSWGQSLAIFLNQKGAYKFAGEDVVGGKFAYYISTLKEVKNGKIVLETESCPEPPQGLCEDPKKGKIYYAVKNGKLKKL